MSIYFFKNILNEVEEEATAEDIFGKYLFAPERNDTPEPKEPNTEKEEKFKKALWNHYHNNNHTSLLELVRDLLNLAKQGKYTKMLIPPKGSIAYRFISADISLASKILGISVDEINSNANKATIIENCPNYKPHKNILSSWTLDPTAINMVYFINKNNNVHILLSALTDENNFLLNPIEMKKNGSLQNISQHFENEMETIGVGPIKIWKAVYLSTKKNNLLIDLLNQFINKISIFVVDISEIVNQNFLNQLKDIEEKIENIFFGKNDIYAKKFKEIRKKSKKTISLMRKSYYDFVKNYKSIDNSAVYDKMTILKDLQYSFMKERYRQIHDLTDEIKSLIKDLENKRNPYVLNFDENYIIDELLKGMGIVY